MANKEPVISFVIPVYKTDPDVFRRCLESLFDMSTKDIEVIAVFDGADPDLEKIAMRFPKVERVTTPHGGAPAARNEGFKHTSGRYVSFWDSDSYAKPEMAKMWLQTFDRNPDAAFVYSGYEIAGDRGAYDSEVFDSFSLQMGNFVASHFPLKRELFPGWDESLGAAQDWDYWLTVAEKGGKGVFIEGYGFITEPSGAGSISGRGWGKDREETIRVIRDKHAVPDNKVCFFSFHYAKRALNMARLCVADYLKDTGRSIENYDLGVSLGVAPGLFKFFPSGMTKIVYWLPFEIECLFKIGFDTSRETIRQAKEAGTINFCNDMLSKNKLKDLGLEAEILDLPLEVKDIETALPKDFSVLVDVEKAYEPLVRDLAKDMPYVKIDFIKDMGNMAPFSRYSLLVSFYQFPTVDESIKGMLINGRSVISNVQAPYCGYLDLEVSHPEFKRELLKRIRQAREYPFNKEAQGYYIGKVDPVKFKNRIMSFLRKPVLEVV